MRDLPFADLHCHPTLYSFNRMRNSAAEKDRQQFHPWRECQSDVGKMKVGARATHYNQANFARQLAAGVKVAYFSFTPIEKGFFIGSAHGRDRPFPKALQDWIQGNTPRQAARKALFGDYDGAIRELLGLIRNDGPLRQLVQKFVMDYPLDRVKFLSSSSYDYWDELLKEYEFIQKGERKKNLVYFETPEGKKKGEGCYRIVESLADFEASLSKADDLALLLTIEGGHVFSVRPDLEPHDLATCLERIQKLKSWEHPILFLTLAHHFYNGLCGHAHSLIDAADWIMDQEYGLNEGIDLERGLPVIRELLDLDENNFDRGGKRILIDIRHMSAQSRKEYYDLVVRPYNEFWEKQPPRTQRRYPKIAVLMSHGAYTGVGTLDDLIAHQDEESDHWRRDGFYAWNINLCDEDVEMIFASQGLAGICFDRRIVGVRSSDKLTPELEADALIRQIFAIVDVIMLDDRIEDKEKARIWDCVCIGSDYDGVIHPVQRYATALDLPSFAEDLRAKLKKEAHTRMIAEIGVDRILEKVLFENAVEFARRNLPAACGEATTKKKKKKTPNVTKKAEEAL